jgi:hypothetical protein
MNQSMTPPPKEERDVRDVSPNGRTRSRYQSVNNSEVFKSPLLKEDLEDERFNKKPPTTIVDDKPKHKEKVMLRATILG